MTSDEDYQELVRLKKAQLAREDAMTPIDPATWVHDIATTERVNGEAMALGIDPQVILRLTVVDRSINHTDPLVLLECMRAQAPMVRTDYSREELIEICERAVVLEGRWVNRDSYQAQTGVGQAWVLLSAECEFRVCDGEPDEPCQTDADTIWLEFRSKGFDWFEGAICKTPMRDLVLRGVPPEIEVPDDRDELLKNDTFWLPTPKRLDDREGKDWYR